MNKIQQPVISGTEDKENEDTSNVTMMLNQIKRSSLSHKDQKKKTRRQSENRRVSFFNEVSIRFIGKNGESNDDTLDSIPTSSSGISKPEKKFSSIQSSPKSKTLSSPSRNSLNASVNMSVDDMDVSDIKTPQLSKVINLSDDEMNLSAIETPKLSNLISMEDTLNQTVFDTLNSLEIIDDQPPTPSLSNLLHTDDDTTLTLTNLPISKSAKRKYPERNSLSSPSLSKLVNLDETLSPFSNTTNFSNTKIPSLSSLAFSNETSDKLPKVSGSKKPEPSLSSLVNYDETISFVKFDQDTTQNLTLYKTPKLESLLQQQKQKLMATEDNTSNLSGIPSIHQILQNQDLTESDFDGEYIFKTIYKENPDEDQTNLNLGGFSLLKLEEDSFPSAYPQNHKTPTSNMKNSQTLMTPNTNRIFTLRDFLYLADIRFSDGVSIGRSSLGRSSLGISAKLKIKQSLSYREILLEFYVRQFEKKLLEDGIEYLTKETSLLNEKINELEKSFSLNNPSIFTSIRTCSPEELTLLKGKLQKVKDHCKKNSKKKWYEWRISILNQFISLLEANFNEIQSNQEDLALLNKKLSELKSALDEEKDELIQVNDPISTSFTSALQSLAKGIYQEVVDEEMLKFTKQIDSGNWKILSATPTQISLHLENQFQILIFKQQNMITKIQLEQIFPTTSFNRILPPTSKPEFRASLLKATKIPNLLNSVKTMDQLSNVLKTVTFRLQRYSLLQKELDQLAILFTIRVKSMEDLKICAEFSSSYQSPQPSKFMVTFQLNTPECNTNLISNYPNGSLPYSFETLFGNVTSEMVHSAMIKSSRIGFGRLKYTFQSLQSLTEGDQI